MSTLQAGYAAEQIIPAQHYDLSGYVARQNPSLGVHDPVQVGGLYLAGEEEALLLSVDVLGFTPEDAVALRLRLAELCDIPAQHIMLAATHTHSAPATMRLVGCGMPCAPWWDELQAAIERVAVQAKSVAQPARIGVGTAHVAGIARNRRNPAGPLDETLTIVKVELQAEQRTVALVNYACHPVVLSADNRFVSADYPGAVTRHLTAHGVDAMFITGACGDINPVTQGEFPLVDDIGRRIGQTVLGLLPATKTEAGPIRAAEEPVTVRWQMPTPEELDKAREQSALSLYQAPAQGSVAERVAQTWAAWTERHRTQTPPWPTELDVTVQVIKAGPAHIVALPGEVFCGTGLFIKEHLGHHTVVAGYTNGNIGYLPTAEEYARVGYEVAQAHVYYGYPGVVVPGTAEHIAQTAVELAQALQASERSA